MPKPLLICFTLLAALISNVQGLEDGENWVVSIEEGTDTEVGL
jgi:hypothetical protein